MQQQEQHAADEIQNKDSAANGGKSQFVTRRAVAIGLGVAAFLCAITPFNDYKVGATPLAGTMFPVAPFFVLLLLIVPINSLLRRFAPARVFGRSELLVIWILLVVASGLPSSGLMRYLLPHIAAPSYFSNGGNNYESKVWGGLPEWFLLQDKAAGVAYFAGYPVGQERIPWEAWAKPLFAWGLFGVCFYVASFCLAALLRRQWVENEKFAFPLVSLPLLLTEEPEGARRGLPALFYQKPFGIAIFLTTVLHGFNGLHEMYPAIPQLIPTNVPLQQFFTSPPWNQLGLFPMLFFPLLVGVAYLLSSEVAFSLWFFFFFYKGEVLAATLLNLEVPASLGSPAEKQFHALQGGGGAFALLCWTLWTARGYLRTLWRAAWTRDAAARAIGQDEMLLPRAMFLGLFLSYLGMALWLFWATLPPHMILMSLLTLTVSLVTVSYLVTQAGGLFTIPPCMTIDNVGGIIGTQSVSPGAWYMTQRIECIYYRDTRELLMPQVLSGAKLADAANFPVRPLFRAMVLVTIIGVAVSAWAALHVPYHSGGGLSLPTNSWTFRGGPPRPLQLSANLASAPLPASGWNVLHLLGGFGGTLSLLWLRARTGFPLHPVGFIGASVVSGRALWFSVFVGWACKVVLLRYGGMNGYRAALPFFLGLITGDVLNAMLWTFLGGLTGTGYNLLPQ